MIDLGQAASIAALVSASTDLTTFIRSLISRDKNNPNEIQNQLREQLHGTVASSQSAHTKFISLTETTTAKAFVVRAGKRFSLPAEWRFMNTAIPEYDLFDWTYVCGDSSEETVEVLRDQYCDADNPKLVRSDISTSAFGLIDNPLPVDVYGEAIYFGGYLIEPRTMRHLTEIDRQSFMVMYALSIDEEGNIRDRVGQEPAMGAILFSGLIGELFRLADIKTHTKSGFTYFGNPSTDKERRLPPGLVNYFGR